MFIMVYPLNNLTSSVNIQRMENTKLFEINKTNVWNKVRFTPIVPYRYKEQSHKYGYYKYF